MTSAESILPRRKWDLPGSLGAFLSFATLLVVIAMASAYIQQPDEGFILDTETGVVIFVNEPCERELGSSCLEIGDEVVAVAGVSFEEYRSDRTLAFFEPFKIQTEVEVRFRRDGSEKTIQLRAAAPSRSFFSKLTSIFFPALFWGMGTIAVIFLRPRDDRWLLLVLLQFDTALWVSSGFVGYSHVALSAVVFDVMIWLFLPLSIHLHLILPDAPFRRFHRWILPPLYASAAILIVLDQLDWVARSGKLVSTLVAMVVSLGLLGLRRWAPGEISEGTRIANQVMFFGVGIGLGPVIILTLVYLVDLSGALASTFFMSLVVTVFVLVSPIWPLTYIYAIYRHDLGTFEFRANRLLGTYGFFAMYITTYIVVYAVFLDFWLAWEVEDYFYGLSLSMIFVALAPYTYHRFQLFVDRWVFGIKYRPDQVVSVFAERIPTAFNREVLQRVIVDEILPTLEVRQSALYELDDDKVLPIYEEGLEPSESEVDSISIRRLLEHAGAYISFPVDPSHQFSWVRVVVPLSIQGEIIGAWLLGRRDPDDYYPRSDISLLTNLANQIAPVIENVRLVEQARQEVAENKKLQQQLVHSQKMEAIGRLSAGVAHDFNNILSVIIGYSNLVMIQYRDDPHLIQAISSIKEAGERASTLTRQLLAFSRKQVMEVRVSNLNAIVADLEKMLRRLTGEDVELTTELGADLPNVRIDPGQMGQVLINLVVNARDAMPEGGRIRIVTKVATVDGSESEHDEIGPGRYALLLVEDSGTGIDPELQGRIFEPYFTTKGHGKGTGLGLSMAYGIINQSQGFIFVDSAMGRGTAFSIYLPAVEEQEALIDEVRRKSLRTSGGTEVILLVEDEQSVRAVTREILRSNGYLVLPARDGFEALEQIDKHPGTIDLLLTDVVMPKMKGPELAQKVLSRYPEIKTIYMSGYNEESILGKRIGEDGSILIQKPFTPQDLCRRVREVLDSRPTSPLAETPTVSS